MKTEKKIKLMKTFKKLSTTQLENILNDTLFEIKKIEREGKSNELSEKHKYLLTVKVIVQMELKDRLEELIKIFETHNIKH